MAKIRIPQAPETLPSGGCVGLDPGKDGTIGYAWAPGEGEFWRLDQMTDQEAWNVVLGLSRVATAAVLEKVHAMPKQGVVSTFKFGKAAGKLEAWLVAAGHRWEWVTPAKWQGDLKCRTGGDKRVTQAKAQQLWPRLSFSQKTAEGPLIAEWGRLYSLLMVGSRKPEKLSYDEWQSGLKLVTEG